MKKKNHYLTKTLQSSDFQTNWKAIDFEHNVHLYTFMSYDFNIF